MPKPKSFNVFCKKKMNKWLLKCLKGLLVNVAIHLISSLKTLQGKSLYSLI